ncbi:MAG: 3-deoxy-7-phosphoheptulonate synthase [Gemmatimonadales bacterium]|nr:3-deoxy-7-phosphoheptulonate synthase [Gemmatimonadales bacterium]
MRIAIQGTHGAFSEMAARRRWPELEPVFCHDFRAVVAAVHDGHADAGILPLENSLIGSVTQTYDLLHEAFEDGVLHLTHEVLLPVQLALHAVPGATLAGIRKVMSHPVALGQCRDWLEKHLPGAELITEWDTAGSAELAARLGDPTVAAIASVPAGERHGLATLATRIEDDATNQTRFLVFARADAELPSARAANGGGPLIHKTSLIITVDHTPGSLASCLQAFAARGVNLTALQSRPERSSPWTYRFYVDIEGARTDHRLVEALDTVEALAANLIVLGSYEAWTEGAVLWSTPRPVPPHYRKKPDMPLFDRRQYPDGTTVQVGSLVFGAKPPVLIAGPCSVEDEEQIITTAVAVAQAGADMLRGGAFKPRTSPYDFQGLGVHGLRLLQEARERTGLPFVTEVMSWEEVPLVAKFSDMLQIGARNMQNFALLRAVGRSGKPVMLKRGAGATVEEWLHAAEYILADGNPNVVLCERGIRTFERATRHTLDLNAVALVRERTHLPVIVDPSHAAGVASLVPALSLGALAAGACGLIVEVHPDPKTAKSDGAQSLDLPTFAELARQVHPDRSARARAAEAWFA